MEGILKVTPQELISTASEFSAKASVVSSLTTEMTERASSLNSTWEGEAASTYLAKFNGLQDDIQRMIRMVQEHVSDLQEMAQIYASAEQSNVTEFESLSSDVII